MENCGSNSPRISIGRVSNNVEDRTKTPSLREKGLGPVHMNLDTFETASDYFLT